MLRILRSSETRSKLYKFMYPNNSSPIRNGIVINQSKPPRKKSEVGAKESIKSSRKFQTAPVININNFVPISIFDDSESEDELPRTLRSPVNAAPVFNLQVDCLPSIHNITKE